MGNIHEVVQTKPVYCEDGAAILVKRRFYDIVEKLHKEETENDYYYTYLKKEKVKLNISNCNICDEEFNDEILYFVIQGGGKIKCGIKDFKMHIDRFSKYLNDALFYMDDEFYGFIDEYEIKNGILIYKRVEAEGSFMLISDFLKNERPLSRDDIIAKLKSNANLKNVEGMKRFGINPNNTLGISISIVRKMAKGIGKNHRLALELWDTGIHEAMILAALVDDPEMVTEKQMYDWADDFDSWDVCDQVCMNLFDKTPFAWDKACQWSTYSEEFVKRAGFALMASLAMHDKNAHDKKFNKFFPYIKKGSLDERNFVKKAVNWALRQVGKRNKNLCREAIKLSLKIQFAYPESKAAKWIAGDAIRELKKQKF
ncbi:MAG: DNA alkylation repair protein [Minisyncoccia bacterium]